MDGVNGTACHRPTSRRRQLPNSSHPPAALTVSGDAGSITCDAGGEAGTGVDTSIDALAVTGAVGAGDDAGDCGDVTSCAGADGVPAPLQPASATAIATMATIDFIIG